MARCTCSPTVPPAKSCGWSPHDDHDLRTDVACSHTRLCYCREVCSIDTETTMNNTMTDWIAKQLDAEVDRTRGTLERVPEGRDDWKPHAKSMPLGRLAMLVAQMPG